MTKSSRPLMKCPRGLLLVLPLVLMAATARHLELLNSNPRKDQTVGSGPIDIALIFSESVDSARTTVSLQGPGGSVELAPIRLQDEALVVLAKVVGPAAAGTYTVSWSAAAPGDDPIKGSFRYTVRPER